MSQLEKPDYNGPIDVEVVAHELEEEIRQKQNAREIAERISNGIFMTRKDGFKVLTRISLALGDQPEVVMTLLEKCSNNWPFADLNISYALLKEGHKEIGILLYEKYFSNKDCRELDSRTLRQGVNLAEMLGKLEEANQMIEILLSRSSTNEIDHDQLLSIAYDYGRTGRSEDAEFLWQRIFKTRDWDTSLDKKYRDYQNKMKKEIARQEHLNASNEVDISKDADIYIERAKDTIRKKEWSKLLDFCKTTFEIEKSPRACDAWRCFAFTCFQEDEITTGIKIWEVILEYFPMQVFAFMKLSEKFPFKGKDPEIDVFIKKTESLSAKLARHPGRKKVSPIKLKNDNRPNPEALERLIDIDGIVYSISEHLMQAGQHVSFGEHDKAIRIWTIILQHDQGAMASVIRGFLRMSRLISPEEFIEKLKIREILQGQPDIGRLFSSIAANLFLRDPETAEKISYQLNNVQPERPGNTVTLSDILIKRRKFSAAYHIWLPLKESHAYACAHCASKLMTVGQEILANKLFKEVAKISPLASIRHGYESFQDPQKSDKVLACIQPLIVTGDEEKLEEHQFFALKLFIRHNRDLDRTRYIIHKLVESGAITREQAYQLGITPPILRDQNVDQNDRDRQIEEYLAKNMPTLRKSNFFSTLEERQPIIDPGRKTSRTAHSVLRKPYRSHAPDTHDPKHRPKRKN
ncbi:MAG: hypothetical protein JWM56_183 [Candidatus Peribacteria bacterium]|nr:hypothetical protein [Candidatus Peribacteria bacterium]